MVQRQQKKHIKAYRLKQAGWLGNLAESFHWQRFGTYLPALKLYQRVAITTAW